MLDPTRRFSNRVENYLKYRPRYPFKIISLLEKECGLTRDSVIADMGSGTGLLSQIFLKHGNPVYGIEPNSEMRTAGEKEMAQYSNFRSVNATAEATTLESTSIDFVTAGQSFHWFDRPKAHAEFLRILRPAGWVVLIWNGFKVESSPLNNAYQQLLLRYGTDYDAVQREVERGQFDDFFAPKICRSAHFRFDQFFDYDGLKGRLLSSSFIPEPGHPNYERMLDELKAVFDEHQQDGKVRFVYETEVYYGQLKPRPGY